VAQVHITEGISAGDGRPLLVIAGPCVIEGRCLCLRVASHLKALCEQIKLPFVFKASFDKANRSSISSFRGVGMEDGLSILAEVKEKVGVPVVTDIHLPEQAAPVAEVVDMLQIPAFLCRQTDLLIAAARAGRPVLIKKGQFIAPEDMGRAAEKVRSMGNADVLLCERGAVFGYHDLVADMRSIVRMKALGYPVAFDVTHSTQRPGAAGTASGGEREMAMPLGSAAVAAGADAVFIETHPQPDEALSDAASMVPLESMELLLKRLQAVAAAVGKP